MQTFEDRLLAELKDVIADRAAQVPAQARSKARRRLRLAVAGVAAAAVATGSAIAMPVLFGGQTNAVARASDGTLKVYVNEYKHPEVLERKLASFGVRADITFLPVGFNCTEPRADYVRDYRHVWALGDHEWLKGTFWRLRTEAIKPGETLVVKYWYDEEGAASMSSSHTDIATGPIKSCVRVPDPGTGEMTRGPRGGVGG